MIKYRLIWFLYFLFIISGIKAQDKKDDIARQSKTFVSSFNKDIFFSNPNIDSLNVEFDRNTPVFLTLYIRPDSAITEVRQYKQYFDLKFEGDLYFLDKELLKSLSVRPEVEYSYMDSIQQKVDYLKLNATLYRDSTTYYFQPPPFYYAAYKGDIKELETILEEKYIGEQEEVSGDSVLIFQGIVEREGVLDQVGLIMGDSSAFSEFVKKILDNENSSWRPYIKGGRPLRSLVDIYIRLNSDNSFTVSSSGRARTVKIKDCVKEPRLYF